METRKHIAAEKKRCGSHNCAQAILHTYADIAGIDEETAMNIANAFGAGMGNMEGTCGGLVGQYGRNLWRTCRGRNGTWHGQQGQSKIYEADAPYNDQVPRKKRSHAM